jgi:hypothetical protein
VCLDEPEKKMWQVLRRYQGVDTNSSQQQHQDRSILSNNNASQQQQQQINKAFLHNQRTIALHEWHEHAVDPNPPSLAIPYDRYVFEKMLRLAVGNNNNNNNNQHQQQKATTSPRGGKANQQQQQHVAAAPQSNNVNVVDPPTVEIQRKALSNLIQLLFEKPQNIHHITKEPTLIPTLVTTSGDLDEDVRRATCVLLRLIAQDRKGAAFLFSTRKDVPANEAHVLSIATAYKNCLSSSNISNNSSVPSEATISNVRRRLADVGEAVRCLLNLCMDTRSVIVSTEALKAMSAFHGFADSPEYTFTLMRAQCVSVYSEIVKAFKFSNNNVAEAVSNQREQCCTAALTCLRLVTNAKEAFLEVLKENVLDSALNIISEYTVSNLFQHEPQQQTSTTSTISSSRSKLLCAALSVLTELVLYTAGAKAAIERRDKHKQPTLLPCAQLSRLHPDPAVRRDAAGALATLCVAEGGKMAAAETTTTTTASATSQVIDLVKDSIRFETDRDVVSSMCRVVCLLSELPAAREMLLQIAEPLKELAANAAKAKDASLEEGAARAAKLVVWVPGQE